MRPLARQESPPTVPTTGLTPYLGLRARLSQIWINKWTVLLLLVLVRVLMAVKGMDQDINSARTEALSACTNVESMGSTMASMPHYLSQGVNELAASGVEKAVNGLMSMLLLSVTGVEEIVVFVLNLLTSTYECLITLVIAGSLHVALQVIEDATSFLNKTLGDIGNGIHNDVNSFQTDLNKFASALNSVPKVFGSNSAIPTLNINSSLDKLNNLALPSGLDEGLTKLNNSIPTFAQVQNFTDNVIRTPFEDVKKLLNESMVAYHFDRSVFPVPAKQQLSFWSNNNGIDDFFQGLRKTVNLLRKVFIGIILVLALLACIPMGYREIWRWRTLHNRAQLLSQNAFDPLDVVQIASRPYTSTLGIKVASKFSSTRRQILVRWFFAYATTIPALFVLMLGLAGLGSALCQYILLKSIEKEVPVLATEVGDFAGKVIDTLNNASEQWAVGTNRVIDSTNGDINKEVLGWVNTTTGAVNDTLNSFVDQMSDALNATFGGTVLYQPITDVLNCLVGLKVAGIEKGLTWISDNAHVDFPNLPNNTFSLGAAESIASNNTNATDSFLSNPQSVTSDEVTSAIVSLTDKIADTIRTEAILAACLVLIWFIVVLIGLIRTIVLFYRRDKTRAEGGPNESDNWASNGENHSLPGYREMDHGRDDGNWRNVPLDDPAGEKVGYAGERTDADVVPGLLRKSSYGIVNEKR